MNKLLRFSRRFEFQIHVVGVAVALRITAALFRLILGFSWPPHESYFALAFSVAWGMEIGLWVDRRRRGHPSETGNAVSD